jgi:hypothetical protein
MILMSFRELCNVVAIVIVGVVGLSVAGYHSWGPWPQLLAGIAVMVVASFAAPVAFGWRDEPPDERRLPVRRG